MNDDERFRDALRRVLSVSKEELGRRLRDAEFRSTLERRVAGALRSAIEAHGPIDKRTTGSAAKRVVGQILELLASRKS
jgi:hypothetical protein